MIYAKIDSEGVVTQFPYHSHELERNIPDELPSDVVEVDTQTNFPSTRWDQVAQYDEVVKIGEDYLLTYTVADRYSNDEDKLEGITTMKRIQGDSNKRNFDYASKQLDADISEGEKSSWATQRAEATGTGATPMLDSIAAARGITTDSLKTKILAKIAVRDLAYGELLGKYQANRGVLASVDLDDSSTWNNIDSLT